MIKLIEQPMIKSPSCRKVSLGLKNLVKNSFKEAVSHICLPLLYSWFKSIWYISRFEGFTIHNSISVEISQRYLHLQKFPQYHFKCCKRSGHKTAPTLQCHTKLHSDNNTRELDSVAVTLKMKSQYSFEKFNKKYL